MAFAPIFGTGFEPGHVDVIPAIDRSTSGIAVSTAHPKTGTYGLFLDAIPDYAIWARVPVDSVSLETSAWLYAEANCNTWSSIQYVLTDGKVIEIRRMHTDNLWHAYVDGTLVADGTIVTAESENHNIAFSVVIGDTGGIRTWVDGLADIVYDGDTKPSAATNIAYVYLYHYARTAGGFWGRAYWDDLVIGSGSDLLQAPDCRFELLVPNSDVESDWTPSTGSDNYALVDEAPPSDADYVSTETDGDRDLYGVSDWDGTSKTPLFLVQWLRAKKEASTTDKMTQILKSGAVESETADLTLSTSFAYLQRILAIDPATSAPWDETGINAISIGQAAVIV